MTTSAEPRVEPRNDAHPAVARRPSYGWVASIYEGIGSLYTGGGIRRSKAEQLALAEPSSRVLYAGAGAGEDAILASGAGHDVTLVDLSPQMLARASTNFAAVGAPKPHMICTDIFDFDDPTGFDMVFANYFLNVFAPDEVPRVVDRLARLVRPGGRLAVADFAPARPNPMIGALQYLYYAPPLVAFCLTTGNAWHGLYDYAPAMSAAGLRIESRQGVRIFGHGPAWLEILLAQKPGEETDERTV